MYQLKKVVVLRWFLIYCFLTVVSRGVSQDIPPAGQQDSTQEKLYIHTDKNFYVAGEIVWFRIYYIDAALHQPLHTSKIAYAEIMDRNNVPVLQAKISLEEKGGQGSFYLPLSLSSDNYILRAYTSRMKNFGSTVFFEKNLTIINTVKSSATAVHPDSPEIIANFFPEGGRLVSGIQTKVGFHVSDQRGRGIHTDGIIVNNKGDTVQQFSSLKFGIGSFLFKPEEGYNYSAILLLPEGKKIVRPLPAADPDGYVMNVSDNKNNTFKVQVQVKNSSLGNNRENVYLLAHTKKSLKRIQAGYVSDQQELTFYLKKEELGEGVSFLTLLNDNQQAVSERLIFIPPRRQIKAVITTDKNKYASRAEVDLSVSFPEGMNMTDSASCSLSVFRIDSQQDTDEPDISGYLWLTSYLQGNVESPGYYFSNSEEVTEATDNLMLTQGWRQLRRNNLAVLKFKTEDHRHRVTGRVINTQTGKLVAGARCYLTVPANPYGFYIKESDSSGVIQFEIDNYYGPGDIIAQVGEKQAGNYRIDISSPFAFDSLLRPPFPLFLARENEKLLRDRSIGMQAQNIYQADSLRKFILPRLTDTLPFFGKAEYSYRLDDYKRFTTMEEVLREYVLPINLTLRNGSLHMGILDEPMKIFYKDNTLVLLDGVPLRDPDKLLKFDPLKLRKLDVIPRRYVIGPLLFWGLASFETYEGKFNAFELDSSLVAIDYEGLQLQREFYSPAYQNGNASDRIPDLRSTLYWQPELNGKSQKTQHVKFYTSDQRGKFFAVLEGISNKGETISTTTSFEVE